MPTCMLYSTAADAVMTSVTVRKCLHTWIYPGHKYTVTCFRIKTEPNFAVHIFHFVLFVCVCIRISFSVYLFFMLRVSVTEWIMKLISVWIRVNWFRVFALWGIYQSHIWLANIVAILKRCLKIKISWSYLRDMLKWLIYCCIMCYMLLTMDV